MVAVIQRVKNASVSVENNLVSSIGKGLLVLLGISHDDTQEDLEWLAAKIVQMRIFADKDQKMNLSLIDIDGEILIISQFTLLASTKKGNRPSFIGAARPEYAERMYQSMIEKLKILTQKDIKSGVFGADMQVSLVNDGPVTIAIDTKNKV
jgi:D-tyrosyl-tRNA(Tyr) deacylase